jgi:hypothetical protein
MCTFKTTGGRNRYGGTSGIVRIAEIVRPVAPCSAADVASDLKRPGLVLNSLMRLGPGV